MSFALNVLDWVALAPGISTKAQWLEWAQASCPTVDDKKPLPKCSHLPMMLARRLSDGSRFAVDCGLQLYQAFPKIDAIVFSSRHGELEHHYQILKSLAQNIEISPTNFTMSVHNSAVGTLSIATKLGIPTSSIAAGKDSFQQGFYEVLSLLTNNCNLVLYIDFDGKVPAIYQTSISEEISNYPYACAFILTQGTEWTCTPKNTNINQAIKVSLPQSLQFLTGLIQLDRCFQVVGDSHIWYWSSES